MKIATAAYQEMSITDAKLKHIQPICNIRTGDTTYTLQTGTCIVQFRLTLRTDSSVDFTIELN